MIAVIPPCVVVARYAIGDPVDIVGPQAPRAGDFGLVHHKKFSAGVIRLGERTRYSDRDPESPRWVGYAYWNHAFLCLGLDLVAETNRGGVVQRDIRNYNRVDWVHVSPKMSTAERSAAAEVARTLTGEKYNYLQIPVMLVKYLTNMNVEVGMGNHQICSGFVATCLFKPFIWPQSPAYMSPADLASCCKIKPW